MHYSDVAMPLPHVPGHEICGDRSGGGCSKRLARWVSVLLRTIIGLVENVPTAIAAVKILCTDLVSWTGFTHPGGFEEFLAIPGDQTLKSTGPFELSVEASTATCASGTAYRAVVSRGQVKAGETAVVIGTGGVGLMAVQFAALSGGRVITLRHRSTQNRSGKTVWGPRHIRKW